VPENAPTPADAANDACPDDRALMAGHTRDSVRKPSDSLPVAAQWFQRERIQDVTLLYEPHVHPLLRCNIWHVPGRDLDLLIDTGLGISSLREAAHDVFVKSLAAVATHTHRDHSGGMHEFAERWVHAAEADSARRARYGRPLDADAYSPAERSGIEQSGYSLAGGLLTAVPIAGYRAASYRLREFEPTRLLEEGSLIDLGDRVLEVLHLPGHSPGSIGLYDRLRKVLFSGDAVYEGPLLDQLPDSNTEAYRLTMERLIDLPVEVVHAGHGRSFGHERLVQLARSYLDRALP
jgi:glyoxylase-like metal-dependent hydrolase (beta-lactamase superfamily II)